MGKDRKRFCNKIHPGSNSVQVNELYTHFLGFQSIKPFVKCKNYTFIFDCTDFFNRIQSGNLNENENLYFK